jgi:anti-sigma B factor antagonist
MACHGKAATARQLRFRAKDEGGTRPADQIMSAPFKVGTETVDGIRVFAVYGELDLENSPQLRNSLQSAIEDGTNGVLVDLTDCEFIDSTGLAVLVAAWRAIEEGNRARKSLVLCCPDEQVGRLLKLTGLDETIAILPGRDEAIDALRN